jgi:hypothetical protein
METKLIKDRIFLRKVADSYVLHRIKDGVLTIEGDSQYAIGGIEPFYKLSLSNCQAVANGYDLDELAEDWCMKPEKKWSNNNNEVGDNYGSFKVGFQKALEVNSDKRFTFKEMVDCWNKALNFQEHKETLGDHIQSLRQTEWDVEICNIMDCIGGNPCNGTSFECNHCTNIGEPKLDADGCLILKRK